MPIIKSAVKRAKQSEKRRTRNIEVKKNVKVATKAFLANPSTKTLSSIQGELDIAVKKGLLKKNTAARRKARFSRIAKESGVKLASAKKAPAKKATTSKKSSPSTVKKAPAKKATAAKKTTSAKKSPAKK